MIRIARASLAAVIAVAVVQGLALLGALQGFISLAIVAVIILLLPVAESLSQRIVIAGCLVSGYGALLASLPNPLGPIVYEPRVSIGVAVALLSFWIFVHPTPSTRIRMLVPSFQMADVFPLATGLVGIALYLWLLTIGSAQAALSFLRTGWDYVSRFEIVQVLTSTGSAPLFKETAEGATHPFFNYPSGFELVLTSIVGLHNGDDSSRIGDLVPFVQA